MVYIYLTVRFTNQTGINCNN